MTARKTNETDLQCWDIDQLAKKYPIFTSTYRYLQKKYNKAELTVDEALSEIQMSTSDFYMKKKQGKGIPCYRQKDSRARITFPLICIAKFLSEDFVRVS